MTWKNNINGIHSSFATLSARRKGAVIVLLMLMGGLTVSWDSQDSSFSGDDGEHVSDTVDFHDIDALIDSFETAEASHEAPAEQNTVSAQDQYLELGDPSSLSIPTAEQDQAEISVQNVSQSTTISEPSEMTSGSIRSARSGPSIRLTGTIYPMP